MQGEQWSQTMIIIDAGSSGSRAHVFYYRKGRKHAQQLPDVQLPQASHKITPGLSTYANEPARARDAMAELLEYVRSQIPRSRWNRTPVFLLATAGLRMIPQAQAEQVLAACADELAASGLMFRSQWASIISGQEEGMYAWVAANYASGALRSVRSLSAHRNAICLL